MLPSQPGTPMGIRWPSWLRRHGRSGCLWTASSSPRAARRSMGRGCIHQGYQAGALRPPAAGRDHRDDGAGPRRPLGPADRRHGPARRHEVLDRPGPDPPNSLVSTIRPYPVGRGRRTRPDRLVDSAEIPQAVNLAGIAETVFPATPFKFAGRGPIDGVSGPVRPPARAPESRRRHREGCRRLTVAESSTKGVRVCVVSSSSSVARAPASAP